MGREGRADTAKGPELGVLLVHGIGDQEQGSTLTQWSDAIAGWLRSWEWTHEDNNVGPERATITQAELQPQGAPANLTMELSFSGGDQAPQQWLFAEGWWANSFKPPSFGELWSWSFTSVPSTSAMHANAIVDTAIRRYRTASGSAKVAEGFRIGLMVAALVVLVMLSPLILTVLTALLIAGLVASALPFDALTNLVKKAQLIAIGTIGDTKRLVESPTQGAAIKTPVIQGIEWLRANDCQRIVIIAHSQGAAVTYKALEDLSEGTDDFERIDSFVSVGSGLPKVHALEYVSSDRGQGRLRIASVVVPIAAATIAVCARYLVAERSFAGLAGIAIISALTGVLVLNGVHRSKRAMDRTDVDEDEMLVTGEEAEPGGLRLAPLRIGRVNIPVGPLITAVFAALILSLAVEHGLVVLVLTAAVASAVFGIAIIAVDEIPPIPNDLRKATRRWLDLYATKDPVPAGPTRTRTEQRPESWPVSNLGSAAKDHTYYALNQDECLTFVGVELLETAGVPIEGAAIREETSNYGFERRWRVGWRSFGTWLTLGLTAVFWARTWDQSARNVADWYERAFAEDAFIDLWYPGGGLPESVPLDISATTARIVSVIAYVVLAAGLTLVTQRLWAGWDRSIGRQRLHAEEIADAEIPMTFRAMVGFLVVLTVTALAPQWVTETATRLDLSASSLFLIVALLLIPLTLGAVLPRLLISLGVKQWVVKRNGRKSDGLVGLGYYQLSRGELDEAIATFRRAMQSATALGNPSTRAAGGLATALDRQASRLETVEPARLAEITDLFEVAIERGDQTSPDVLVAYANFLAATGPDVSTGRITLLRAMRAARRQHLDVNSGRLITARLAHLFEADDSRLTTTLDAQPPRLVRLAREIEDQLLPPQRMVTLFTLVVAQGPGAASTADRKRIEQLLAQGTTAHDADLRVSLRRLPGGWEPEEAEELRALARRIMLGHSAPTQNGHGSPQSNAPLHQAALAETS